MHIRILSNISLIALSLNKISDCRNYFNQICDIIDREKNIFSKILLFKEVIYIFFRIESLNNFYEENIANNELFSKERSSKPEPNEINLANNTNAAQLNPLNLNKNINNANAINTEKAVSRREKEQNELAEEEILKKNISKTLLALHKFLRDSDIETWIRCLVEESAYFKSVKDVNGYVFTIINQYAANYYQNGKLGDFKNIYQTIINNYGERAKEKNKDKSPEKILMEMKSRIELAIDIYRRLVEIENELFNLFSNRNNLGFNADSGNKNKLIVNAINFNNNLVNNSNVNANNNNREKENVFGNKENLEINEINVKSNNEVDNLIRNNGNLESAAAGADKNKLVNHNNNNNLLSSTNFLKENEVFQEENNNSNKFLIKLFFKHALYQLNKQSLINNNNNFNKEINENAININKDINNNASDSSGKMSSVKNQIELALKLLENDEFDVSSINFFNINSEVTKSLRILFENIKMIRNKKEMQKALKTWKVKGLGYEKFADHMKIRYQKSNLYFKGLLDEIVKGNFICF